MKIVVFKSSNSNDWFWKFRFRSVSAESSGIYRSKAAAINAAVTFVTAVISQVSGEDPIQIQFNEKTLTKDGVDYIELTWGQP